MNNKAPLERNRKRHVLSIIGVALSVLLVFQISACSAGLGRAKEDQEVPITACKDPRPEICTMDYQPVCGQLKDGSFKTYSNGCSSCADSNVVGYRDGACE